MRVDIDENTSAVINELVHSKQFDNPMHVIQYAVHQLKFQGDPMAGWDEDELRAEIQKGIDSLEAGEGVDAEQVFDEMEARLDARIQRLDAS